MAACKNPPVSECSYDIYLLASRGAKKKQTFFLKGSHFCTSHIIHFRGLIYQCCRSSGNFDNFLSVFWGGLVTAYYVGSAIMRAPEQIVGCRKEKEVKDS